MSRETEATKAVGESIQAATPKAKSATAVPIRADAKPAPLPLPEPLSRKSPKIENWDGNDDTPIRTRRWWIGSTQIKLACAGIAVATICIGGIVFLVSRIQFAKQVNTPDTQQARVQVKSPLPRTIDPLPLSRPVPDRVPLTKPKEEPKSETPVKKPPQPMDDDPFFNPRTKLPDLGETPVQPRASSDVAVLVKQLSDKDETVRLKAAKELGRLKEKAKEAIPALKAATADDDEDVREVAKKSLAAIQAASGDKHDPVKPDPIKPDTVKADVKVTALIKDLRSKDNKVRLAAISKLEDLGPAASPAAADVVEFGMMSPNEAIREAANAAMEKIAPHLYKDIITIIYDKDPVKKDLAVESLSLQGAKAKPTLAAIKGYHDSLFNASRHGEIPAKTIIAMVKIAPDDVAVQREVLKIIGLPVEKVLYFSPGAPAWGVQFSSSIIQAEIDVRESLIGLMRVLKIEDTQKVTPILTGFAVSGNPALIKELGNLNIEQKAKCTALLTALSKKSSVRAFIIAEIAKLGADAKVAIPTLKSLKTDPEDGVRSAALAAIEAIKD